MTARKLRPLSPFRRTWQAAQRAQHAGFSGYSLNAGPAAGRCLVVSDRTAGMIQGGPT